MLWLIVMGLGAALGLILLPIIGVSMLRKRQRILETPLSKIHALGTGRK
jgi:hypothetical protein